MNLFGLRKNITTVNNHDIENEDARFIVLGACCKKSTMTYENTIQAVKELGYKDIVVNIGDHKKIASYGVMSTPALVVDGNVVSMGRLLQVKDIHNLILNNVKEK